MHTDNRLRYRPRRDLLGLFVLLFLLPPIASAKLEWVGCGITKKAFMAELSSAYEATSGTPIDLAGGGATRGLHAVAEQRSDLGGSCRMALPHVHSQEMNVRLHPIAWDALVVAVHPANPIDAVSSKDIYRIFTGAIRNWQALGGPDRALRLHVRGGYQGKYSGVGYAVRQYILHDTRAELDTPFEHPSSGPLEEALETDRWGLGVTGLSSAQKRDLKLLELDGVPPTVEQLKAGEYRYYRPLYLITSRRPNPETQAFLDFARSAEGKAVIRRNGSLPYSDALRLMTNRTIYGEGVRH